jgi:hypothetical protein
MPSTTGRRVIEYLTNKSGGAVAAGDVVIVDISNNESFTTTTTAGYTGTIGVAQEAIANNAAGRILTAGYAALVTPNASVTRGNFGKTHSVAKQATDAGASRVSGAFCQFLTGGTTPSAHLFGLADATTGSGASGVPSGTSFPGSPATNDIYFRTDRGLLYYYNGTRWLTVDLYRQEIAGQTALTPFSANATLYAALWAAQYDVWMVDLITNSAVLTTNDGSHFWTIALTRGPSGTALASYTTAADTLGVNVGHRVSIGALTGTSDTYFAVDATKTSTPGNLYLQAAVTYRLVG